MSKNLSCHLTSETDYWNSDSIGYNEHRRDSDRIVGLKAHEKILHYGMCDEKKLSNCDHSSCFWYSLEFSEKDMCADAMPWCSSNNKFYNHSVVLTRDFKDHCWCATCFCRMNLHDGMIKADDHDFHGNNPLELVWTQKLLNLILELLLMLVQQICDFLEKHSNRSRKHTCN